MRQSTRFAITCTTVSIFALIAAANAAAGGLSALSDEFDDPSTIANWQRHYAADGWQDQAVVADIDQTSPGDLYIEPEVSTWYQDYRGVYFFKEVTGDFVVTTRVNVTGLTTPVPTRSFSLAGLMVRRPRDVDPSSWTPGGENWLFITTGAGNPPGSPQIETKDTIDSHSELILTPSVTGWVRLRIERRGSTFNLYRRFPGEPWVLQRVIERDDMPDTLQVGLHAYTDWGDVSGYPGGAYEFNSTIVPSPPGHRDLVARFDWIRFQRPPIRARTGAARLWGP